MKKALRSREDSFLSERNGRLEPWGFPIEEILAAVNRGLKGDWGGTTVEPVLRELYEWISRYIEKGATEGLINELNTHLHAMQYYKYVVPEDFFSSEDDDPQCLFVANLNITYTPKSYAANEFSKLITSGVLKRLKRCQLPGCENIFLGPPQAKWCTPTCGSKYRVRKKRKRDLE